MAVSTLLRRVGRLLTNPSEGGQLVFIGKGDRKPPKQVDMGNSGLEEKAARRVVKIVQAIGGHTYLSGPGGANYQSIENFESFGIQLEYLKYPDFNYPQSPVGIEGSNRSEFQHPLSVLDFLFTCGDESRDRFSLFLRCSG